MDGAEQTGLDTRMNDQNGKPNKEKFGANISMDHSNEINKSI